MREMGLPAIYPDPNLSKHDHQHRIYPLLAAGFGDYPTLASVRDRHYLYSAQGWLVISDCAAIIDWRVPSGRRYGVSWELTDTLEIEFVLKAVKEALAKGTPQILNSDQGSHLTSPQYTSLVKEAGVKISMDGRGRALDNIFTQRLWRSVKYEWVYLNEFESPLVFFNCY